jgi:HEAT repeat protein
VGAGAPEVLKAMSDRLEDPDPAVRRHAASCLGQLGPLARPAEVALKSALDDPQRDVRDAVARALQLVAP